MERQEEQPAAMNAFELISMSKGLNLGNLFDVEQVRVPFLQTHGIITVSLMDFTSFSTMALCHRYSRGRQGSHPNPQPMK